MGYTFNHKESLTENIRVVAAEQIDAAVHDLQEMPEEEAVHAVRKHCKKLRALLRLVRAETEHLYPYENAQYRTIANSLSTSRDAVSLRDALLKVAPGSYPQIQSFLERRADYESDRDAMTEARLMLEQAGERTNQWPLEQLRWKHARKGYRKGFRRARKAMLTALADANAESIHTLRKRVKDHWYHTRLLEKRFPEISPHRKPLKELSQALGDWRDLHLLRSLLARQAEDFPGELIPFLDCASTRLESLDNEIEQLCSKLFSQKRPPLSRNKK